MDNIQIVIALVVAIWASINARSRTIKEINRIRDTIIIGYIGEQQLSFEHRNIMFKNDWFPMAVGIVSMSILFGVLFFLFPAFVEQKYKCIVFILSGLVGLFNILIGLISGFQFYKDYSFIFQNLKA